MRLRRLAVIVTILCACSGTAGAYVLVVADIGNIAEHVLLNVWAELKNALLDAEISKIGHMAQRLSAWADLARYVAPDAPLWRTRRIVPALPASDAYMDALNGGDAGGGGYAAVARARVAVGDVFARFGAQDVAAENALRAALATLDVAASAIVIGTDQTGRIRGSRRNEVGILQALEDDVANASVAQSTTAVVEKVSAAALIRARQQDTRIELLTALTEQWLVDSKRDRDTDVAVMNMQLGRLMSGRAVAGSVVAGAADAFRTWRQP